MLSYHAKIATPDLKPDNAQAAAALGLSPDIVDQNGMLTTSRDVTKLAVVAWFAAEDNNQWLLIIDNYDDLKNVNIYEFLPPSSSGSVLITSRSRDTCRVGKALEVQEVTEDEALEILRKSSDKDMASFRKGMHLSHSSSNVCEEYSTHNLVTYSDLFLVMQNRVTL